MAENIKGRHPSKAEAQRAEKREYMKSIVDSADKLAAAAGVRNDPDQKRPQYPSLDDAPFHVLGTLSASHLLPYRDQLKELFTPAPYAHDTKTATCQLSPTDDFVVLYRDDCDVVTEAGEKVYEPGEVTLVIIDNPELPGARGQLDEDWKVTFDRLNDRYSSGFGMDAGGLLPDSLKVDPEDVAWGSFRRPLSSQEENQLGDAARRRSLDTAELKAFDIILGVAQHVGLQPDL